MIIHVNDNVKKRNNNVIIGPGVWEKSISQRDNSNSEKKKYCFATKFV